MVRASLAPVFGTCTIYLAATFVSVAVSLRALRCVVRLFSYLAQNTPLAFARVPDPCAIAFATGLF
jgi:hypothetical protein